MLEISKIEDAVLDSSLHSYNLCKIAGVDVLKMITGIRESSHAYKLAKLITDGVALRKLEDMACNNSYYAYLFARDIPSANIIRLEDIVIRNYMNNPDDFTDLYDFALNVSGATVDKFEDLIINSVDYCDDGYDGDDDKDYILEELFLLERFKTPKISRILGKSAQLSMFD